MRYLEMYNPYKIEIERAKGIYIFDKYGKKYIDSFSGIGVMALGHSNEKVNNAIVEKLKKHSHVSNFFLDENTEKVSKLLSGEGEKVFFTNSGTESTEFALKIVKKIIGNSKILYFKNAFHGRSLGALSVNGFENLTDPYKPLLPNTIECEFNDIEQLKKILSENKDIKAIFFEVLQGSGGVNPIKEEFIDIINKNAKEKNIILVADEIQSGLYRTGYKFAFQKYNIKPDIITVAKALGGGLPLGAVIMKKEISQNLEKGDHGSTFAPNPISLAAAKVVLEELPKISEQIIEKSIYFIEKIKQINTDKIKEIRGYGLMIGIELKEEDKNIINKGLEQGIILNILKNKVIRLLPALNISYEEIDEIIEKLRCLL